MEAPGTDTAMTVCFDLPKLGAQRLLPDNMVSEAEGFRCRVSGVRKKGSKVQDSPFRVDVFKRLTVRFFNL